MAKATKTPKSVKTPDSVTVRYDLHDLPTAQHKAGLAGLLLQIESMNERRGRGAGLAEPPQVLEQGPAVAVVRFTGPSTQALFDDLYEAKSVEALVAAKWAGKEPKAVREMEVPDKADKAKTKTKVEKRFVYDVVQPTGPFLAKFTDGKDVWHKLWRDMLWAIPRGKPTTRGPFNSRAEGKPTKDGADAWDDLLAHEKAKVKGGLKTVEVAGAVLLGAQALSAESVKFSDRADHAVLLHFWQLTARVFVPEQIDAEGQREFVKDSYSVAVPEVSDLIAFNEAYPRSLAELDGKARGYRPAGAVISLAAEGALAFMIGLDRLASAKVLGRFPADYLSGVEFFHMVKLGNNVKTAAYGRVAPDRRLLDRYDGLVARNGVHNPLLLAGCLRSLLKNKPWFALMDNDLTQREWSWFVHSEQSGHATPLGMRAFAWEVAGLFDNQRNAMSEPTPDRPLPPSAVDVIVKRLIDDYVLQMARGRLGVPQDAARQSEKTHYRATGKDGNERWLERSDFQEERRRAASGLYLELRSRHGDDFVDFFSLKLSAVAQYLPTADYAVLSAALFRQYSNDTGEDRPRTRDDVKTLSLLALSASSRSLMAKSADPERPADAGEGE